MIQNFKKNKTQGGYSTEVANRYVGVDLPFINVTQKAEPIHLYDQNTKRYTDDIVSYRIYVAQNYGDFIQNPIPVRVNSKVPNDLSFGQKVKLKKLQACIIREKTGFSKTYFKADGIEILVNKNDEK